jgi:hypothetical protein
VKRTSAIPGPMHRLTPAAIHAPERDLSLTCRKCGVTATYRVGKVLLRPDKDASEPEDHCSFTAHFRCVSCKASGPWSFTAETLLITMGMIARKEVQLGRLQLFDGTPVRSPAEGEDLLKARIAESPESAFLWTKLGNLYKNGGALGLAREALTKAIDLAPDCVEAHHLLGQILFEDADPRASVPHFHAVLRHAREAEGIDRDLLRDIVRSTLDHLLALRRAYPEVEAAPDPDAKAVSAILGEPRGCEFRPSRRLERWMERSRMELAGISSRPARNGPCPCGSGRKYKNCCDR